MGRFATSPGTLRRGVMPLFHVHGLLVSGSAPLLAETHHEFLLRTGHTTLERYGMTETLMNTSNRYEGEGVTAVVVALPAAVLREADIINSIQARLARYKVPKRVTLIDVLRRNTMGKVQKNVLRAAYSSLYEAKLGALTPVPVMAETLRPTSKGTTAARLRASALGSFRGS